MPLTKINPSFSHKCICKFPGSLLSSMNIPAISALLYSNFYFSLNEFKNDEFFVVAVLLQCVQKWSMNKVANSPTNNRPGSETDHKVLNKFSTPFPEIPYCCI